MRKMAFVNQCELRHNVRRLYRDQQSRYNRRLNRIYAFCQAAGAGEVIVKDCGPNLWDGATVDIDGERYHFVFSRTDDTVTDVEPAERIEKEYRYETHHQH